MATLDALKKLYGAVSGIGKTVANAPNFAQSPTYWGLREGVKAIAPLASKIKLSTAPSAPATSGFSSGSAGGGFGGGTGKSSTPGATPPISQPTAPTIAPVVSSGAYSTPSVAPVAPSAPRASSPAQFSPSGLAEAPTDVKAGWAAQAAAPVAPVAPTPVESMESMYDVSGVPKYVSPDLATATAEADALKPTFDEGQWKSALDQELASIAEKYNIMRSETKQQTESEKMGQISGLYDVGVVNPLSSGVSSIGVASQKVLDERIRNIAEQEGAEKSAAMARAYGLKTDAQSKALAYAQNKKAEIEQKAATDYETERQYWTDARTQLDDMIKLQKSKREITDSDKESSRGTIDALLKNFGSGAFEGIDANDLATLEKSAGLPKGSLHKGLVALKEQELSDEASKEKYMEVSPGASIFDPATGEWVGTAPQKAGASEQKIVKINGKDYVQNADGSFSEPSLPSVATSEKAQKAAEIVSKINSLLATDDWKAGVGPLSANMPDWMSGKRNTAVANIESVVSSIALENLGLLKGPMSDKDIQFIKDASAGLRTNMSEAGFLAQINKIKNKFTEIQQKALLNQQYPTATPEQLDAMLQSGVSSAIPAQYQEDYNYLIQQGDTPEQARSTLNFSYAPSKAEKGSQNISLASKISQKYAYGSTGGQCGTWAHNIVDFPPVGDSLNEKINSVKKYGKTADNWRSSGVKVGDIIITNEAAGTGHVAVVNALLPGGQVQLSESNYYQKSLGPEKVSQTRKLSVMSPSIMGAIRGTVKV